MDDKIKLTYSIIEDFVIFSSLIFSIYYWKYIKISTFKLFPFYTFISFSFDVPAYIFSINNVLKDLLVCFFAAIEFFMFYTFYQKVLDKKFEKPIKILRLSYPALLFISLIFYFISVQDLESSRKLFGKFYSGFIVIEEIFLVIPVLVYYKSQFSKTIRNDLTKNPVFLAMTGILFCFTISIPVFVFRHSDTFKHSNEVFLYLYVINSIGYITMHLFFIRAYINLKHV